MVLDFELLYNVYTQDFISLVQSEEFYSEFMNKAMSGNTEVSYMHRFIDKQIDLTWVKAIEDSIIALDTIIRNPRRFIVQEEEIVNIELARKISPESIRHLAQHTNMIAKVEEDTVTPNRILNIFKEESFETYENRFIYTLLINLQYFISKRLSAINDSAAGNNVTSILFKDSFNIGKENVKCSFEMTIDSPGFKMDANLLDVDPEKLSKFQRVERIKKILYDFQNSPLIKTLSGCTLVRPPIMRTNVLQKNPDFKKAKALWDFIETYRDSGFSVEVTETNEIPNELYLSELYSTMVLNYSILKHHIGKETDYEPQKKRKIITPKIIERTFMEVLDDLTFDIDVVQRIFNEQVAKTTKKRQKQEREVLALIDRALKVEQKRKDDIERARLEALEREKQEKLRLREEQKKRLEAERLAKEQERLEKQRIREEQKRLQEEEKLRREQERQARKEALEREKELEKQRKEKEKLKLQKQKQALAEKERKAKEQQKLKEKKAREQQKLKEQKAAELAKQKEAERKRKEQEKLKLQQQALAEKERERKLKEQQKLKEQKAAELAKQKEAERKRKEQEKLKLQQQALAEKERERKLKEQQKLKEQKLALAEKEREQKAREQQKLKEQKAKELAQQKEAERKRKEQEKLKQQKLALAEKERERKAKEQQKLKEQKAKELAKQKEAERLRKERDKLKLQQQKQALAEKEKLRKAKEKEKLKAKQAKEAALRKEQEAKIKAEAAAKIEALKKKSN